MFRVRSIICFVLAVLMLLSVSINQAVAQNTDSDTTVTSHDPKTRMSEVKKDTGKKSSNTWLWILLGVVVVGGGIAALAGGGSNDSGSSGGSSTTTSTTGNYDFTW